MQPRWGAYQLFLWLICIFTCFCRIGEAANPGPAASGEMHIGCINPTGLLGRGQLIADLPKAQGTTLWAISESHLTAPGYAKFQKELRYHKTGYHLQVGAHTPSRSNTATSIAGKHRGVAFLSTSPCRAMTPTWPKDSWNEARFHVSCFQVQHRWVQGGVVYGHAAQSDTLHTRSKTDAICQHVVQRLLHHSQGLRFIAGDFNQPDGNLPSMIQLREAGWVNAQQWALERLNKPIEATCKNKTTKDHLYLSPELALFLKDVEVQHDWFPDHSVLIAKFHPLGRPPKLPLWRQPKPIPWETVSTEQLESQFVEPSLPTDSSDAFHTLCLSVEDAVSSCLPDASLPPACFGRAQTREVRWKQEFSAPPKKGREGEYETTFHGLNLQHARWLRQYRRLLNLSRMNADNAKTSCHRNQLWKSIVNASGFRPTFADWLWTAKGLQLSLEPTPERAEIEHLCTVFHLELQAFEKALNQHRTASAKQRRVDDPNVIFQDLKQQPPQPVQMLLNRPHATVVEVDVENNAVVVEPEQDWHESCPLQLPGGASQVVHAEPDKVWVDDLRGVQLGDRVSQEQFVGELNALFQQFGKEWKKRWDRHANFSSSKWDPVISFAEMVLPRPPPMSVSPITVADWDAAVRRKSKKAATGPDGLSRQDLMNWPLTAKQLLVDLINRIEQGLSWPQQMVTGFVVALEKTPGAETVNQYRPITVFSLVYRTWSSIRARQVLAHLQPWAPTTCTGNLPGKHSAHVWYGVMQEIEVAQLNGGRLSGWVIDLIKAFNMLPRCPILHFMSILNVAPGVMLAWGNALTSMERRFKLHNCVGPSIRSCTGFPEGCALSVTAMLAHNLVSHYYLKLKHPSVTLWSYVDNIESTAPEAPSALEALDTFERFSDLMDVAIDLDKSYAWSVAADQRKFLRSCHQVTKLQARDLGGHIQYSKVVTNSTITGRCEDIKPLWGRLARSLAPYKQKLRALVSKAWPSCLHGIASVHMADDHYDRLRTGALQGLGEHSSGASPIAHLSLVETPKADPQYHALLQTIMMFREHNWNADCASFCLSELHQVRKTYVPRPGPVSVMLNRLHQVAWSWDGGANFIDHNGLPICLLDCAIQELKARLVDAWQARVKGLLSQRKTFLGIQWTCPELTMSGTKHFAAEDLALLRTCLNGTFFTADRKKHQSPDANLSCVFCGEKDSQVHRHWCCPFFSSCRTVTAAQSQEVANMMPCIAAHGWMPEPPSLHAFRKHLMTCPDERQSFVLPGHIPSMLYAFTDGGCLAPTCALGRLAMWGVVIADASLTNFVPVSNGIVHGYIQTALRGEICAATSACLLALSLDRPIALWIDNDLVFKRIQVFRRRQCVFKPNQKDADLWKSLSAAVRALGDKLVGVQKVCSHQDPSLATDAFEDWVFRGNQAADRAAENALLRYQSLYNLWLQLQQDISHIHTLRNHVHKTLIQVGKKAVQQRPSHQGDKQHVERVAKEDLAEVTLQMPALEDLPSKYNFDSAHRVLSWISQLTDPAEPIKCISWFQLNILFEHQTGCHGVRHVKKRKVWIDGKYDAQHVDFVRRTNYLSDWIQGVIKTHSSPITLLHLRPESNILQFWTQCLCIRLRGGLIQLADDLFQEAQFKINSVRSLRNL